MKSLFFRAALAAVSIFAAVAAGKEKPEPVSAIDQYIREATMGAAAVSPSRGSLYTPYGMLGDLSMDLRARNVDDVVTIVVADRASAVSRGATNTARKSSANASVPLLYGPTSKLGGRLAGLAEMNSNRQLQGQGETSRESVLTTTISARVTHVLPNGNMVVEGVKDVWVNAERQQVSVRGVVRGADVDENNLVRSDRLGNLEIRVNGRGVVDDAIRRPNFLYRLLLGALPF
ncbi:MAG: flagellar basal body L-ring protein FlgH [Bryobacteraceae bacterium]|nr:flagellar basal body L-ring protein FlgH [Bryobacteraceae bacterium]